MENLLNSPEFFNVASLKQEKALDNRLERALIYRSTLYPVIESYLDPQNQDRVAITLQKDLEKSVTVKLDDHIENHYYAKAQKSKVLSAFIDQIFSSPEEYGVLFNSPPSVNDKLWANILLVHDVLYYGPTTVLCMERVFAKYEDLSKNPIFSILSEIVFGQVVTEIRVNNYRDIYYECGNSVFKWQIPFISETQLSVIIERMISESNLLNNSSISLNTSSPIADFEHPCGYIRGAGVIPPACEESFLTLRIHPDDPYDLDQLIKFGMLSQSMSDFLLAAQKAGTTIAIAGTMGSGKTTLLSALAEHWPDNGRKATIEDTPELRPKIDDLVKMRTIEHDRDDIKNIDVTRLTKACKRHSVRYVVLSEARDASAWEILQLSQAILGSLMTFHYTARGEKFLVDQALSTLVSLCKQHPLAPQGEDIKHQIASMVQILLLIEQDPIDNIRRVIKIFYVSGYDEMNGGHFKYTELFKYSKDPENMGFTLVNSCPDFEEYLSMKGVKYQFKN